MSTGVRIAAVAGGLLLITQIVLLTIQLGVLRKSYSHIRAQDAKQSELYPLQKRTARNALPVLHAAGDAIEEINPAMRGTRRLAALVFSRDVVGTLEQTATDVHVSRAMFGRSLQLQEESIAVQRQSLEMQRRSLAIQEQALAILQQSRGIQDETLQHARSIDNKTGGPLPR